MRCILTPTLLTTVQLYKSSWAILVVSFDFSLDQCMINCHKIRALLHFIKEENVSSSCVTQIRLAFWLQSTPCWVNETGSMFLNPLCVKTS